MIDVARQRHLPLLTLSEAARRAGITPAGWSKVIKTGRGREDTLLAMARVVGVEDKVREALGVVPLRGRDDEGNVMFGLPPDMTLDERRTVLAYIEVKRAAERRGA
jgi:hypothetical protein